MTLLLAFGGCQKGYDDSALWDEVNGLKTRLAELEKQVNARIATLQELVEAVEGKKSITDVLSIPPDAVKPDYYLVTFSDNTSLIWSDHIQIPECDQPLPGYDVSAPACYTLLMTDGTKTYLYNWHFVNAFQDDLCPHPWHVPALSDIQVMKTLVSVADMRASNWRDYSFQITPHEGVPGYLWSYAEYNATQGYMLDQQGIKYPTNYAPKVLYMNVRCVQ
jgi:hypothetical protein